MQSHLTILRYVLLLALASGARSAAPQASQQAAGAPTPDPLTPPAMVPSVPGFDALLPRTPDERVRSRYFGFGSDFPRLREIVTPGTADAFMTAGGRAAITDYPEAGTIVDAPLRQLVCEMDAILVGRIESSAVFLTADESWLFTDHDVTVLGWLKPVNDRRTSIVMSHDGGIVNIAGGRLWVYSSGSRSGFTNGEVVLMALKRIPGTDSYALTYRPTPVEVSTNGSAKDSDGEAKLRTILRGC